MTTKIVHCTLCDGSGFVTRIHKTERSCGIARATCPRCRGTGQKEVPMTNADRIRAMSDRELATLIYNGISSDPCDYCENSGYCDGTPCKGKASEEIIANWLKQPAEEKA